MFRKITLNILIISTVILLGYNLFVLENENQRREWKLEQENEKRDYFINKLKNAFTIYLSDSTTKYNNSNLSLWVLKKDKMFSRNYLFNIVYKGENLKNKDIPLDCPEFVKLSLFLNNIIYQSKLISLIDSYSLSYSASEQSPTVRFTITQDKIVVE